MNRETGLNLTSGGKRPKMSEETLEKLRQNSTGSNNSMYNKKHSEETKEKIRQKAFGRKASAETKLKMSSKKKGIPKSQNWKENMSKGSTNKIKVCTIFKGKRIEFNSIIEAAKFMDINRNTITKSLAKKTKSKYTWSIIP